MERPTATPTPINEADNPLKPFTQKEIEARQRPEPTGVIGKAVKSLLDLLGQDRKPGRNATFIGYGGMGERVDIDPNKQTAQRTSNSSLDSTPTDSSKIGR